MKRSIITTADGSKTIQIEEWSEQYHSVHGALQEAKHVYIKMGLHQFLKDNPNHKQLSVLELGFGTGLNACLLYTSPSPRDRQKSRMPSSA